MAYYESLGVNDMHRWVEPDGDEFILMSPIDGEPLNPVEPPVFMMEHPRLAEGAGYLQTSMNHSLMRVVYADGETDAEHLSAFKDDDTFERQLNGEEFINVVAHTVDGVRPLGRAGLMELAPGVGNAYTKRVATAALMAGASILYAGLEVDPDSQPFSITERRLKRIAEMATAQASDPSDVGAGALAAEIIARNDFQWYRALSLTQQFKKLRDAVAQHEGSFPRGIMMLAPVKDLDYGDKFDRFANSDMEASMYPLQIEQGIIGSDSDTEMMHLQRDAMRLGRLTTRHLDVAEEIRGTEPLRAF